VHIISLTLRAALDTERRGDREEALEMSGRALAASREAEFRISRPYDELSALRGERPPGPQTSSASACGSSRNTSG
jgi:hypothetical protein